MRVDVSHSNLDNKQLHDKKIAKPEGNMYKPKDSRERLSSSDSISKTDKWIKSE